MSRACSLVPLAALLACGTSKSSGPPIPHVVVLVQENHTFDTYFGRWCSAAAGSAPTCNAGPSCCEAAPATEPSGHAPVVLDDAENAGRDPNHSQICEEVEIDDGGMDRFASGPPVDSGALWGPCEDPQNFALVDGDAGSAVQPYRDWAAQYALADRYFQPAAGASSENDMYFAGARFFFADNTEIPDTLGEACTAAAGPPTRFDAGQTVADVLADAGAAFTFYADGYAAMKQAGGSCPVPPPDCPLALPVSPCLYSPGDDPFLFFPGAVDAHIEDFAQLQADISAGQLPQVAFVKALGYRTEHPGYGNTISAGVAFAQQVVNEIESSAYAKDTLVLVTWDEGGGFFDHVSPPPESSVDGEPYGTRVPLIAIGPFAKKGYVSHVTMEHSSIVAFLEWDFTGKTGQLGARDAVVNGLGSLLDPSAVGQTVP
ncbi:MAG: alkaline phosphatase family protein [Myxococcales bacterium]